MIWTFIVPIVSLILFFGWMMGITLRARASLAKVRSEVTELNTVVTELKGSRRFSEEREYWLDDTYNFINRNSSVEHNPLLELISRLHAMRELASPDIASALSTVSDRELDKLEIARETPSTLLLLGIMGTVVGMVIALASFGLAGFQDEGSPLNVGRIMSSMFIAFISTGFALFMSISTRSYLEDVALEQSEMLSNLESYAFTTIAPILLPKHDSVVQQRFTDLVEQQQRLLGESLEKSTVSFNAFTSRIDEAQQVTHSLNEALALNGQAVKLIGERVTTDLTAVNADVSKKLAAIVHKIGKDLSEQREGLESTYSVMKQAVNDEKQVYFQQSELSQQRFNDTVDLLRDSNFELTKGLTAMSAELSSQMEQQTETVRALRQEVSRLSERVVVKQNHFIEEQEEYQRNFMQSVQEFLRNQFNDLAQTLGGRRR